VSIAQLTREGNREVNREIRKEFVAALIKGLKQRQVALEVRRSRVRMLQRFQMTLIPGVMPGNPNLVDGYIFDLRAAAMDRNRQPLLALWRFDLITVPPATFIVLHIIIKNEQIGAINLIKISSPGNVRWLENDNVHFSTTS
jgi:hypothetical protein